MVFSSISFLYYFLPIVLFFYFLVPKKWKNGILLISSFAFYFYGEPQYVLILLFSCIFSYLFGKFISITQVPWKRKGLLVLSLLINFGILFYFKYYNFFASNINQLFPNTFPFLSIVMPIGISFFSFQSASYLIDIYRKTVPPASSFFTYATYLSLFPQLIAGPIVRYETISQEMRERSITISDFSLGIERFILGLSKKIMIADVLGLFSKEIASLSSQTILGYWLRAIADALQLYFDFSGYSDMAIGLGLMFGFHFLENFNYPFIATSITDFWRRWHISLSSWFRDYVYIPLGGNRVSSCRHYFNILIVWMTTGLWHGASWNFVLWGLYFAVFLIIEKKFFLVFLRKHSFFSHIYTIFLVVISFVIFNQTNPTMLVDYLRGMFGLAGLAFVNSETLFFLRDSFVVLFIAILCSMPLFRNLRGYLIKSKKGQLFLNSLEIIGSLGLLLLCTSFIIDESFQPFLYFRF